SNIADDEELTLLRRIAEIKFLLENKLPKTIENLKSSKIKQIKTENRQKKVTFDTLKIDDEVYIKNVKIQNKFEQSYTGPFFIDRITENKSYPRWRLKLAKQEVSTTNSYISDDKNEKKDEISEIEKILDHKKIGRGFKYLIKWKKFPHKKNEWKKSTDIQDKNHINEYHNNLQNRPKSGRKKENNKF
ncbi:hypothetical protein BpHYR1_047435, partial [Brachionus plicatilis]